MLVNRPVHSFRSLSKLNFVLISRKILTFLFLTPFIYHNLSICPSIQRIKPAHSIKSTILRFPYQPTVLDESFQLYCLHSLIIFNIAQLGVALGRVGFRLAVDWEQGWVQYCSRLGVGLGVYLELGQLQVREQGQVYVDWEHGWVQNRSRLDVELGKDQEQGWVQTDKRIGRRLGVGLGVAWSRAGYRL